MATMVLEGTTLNASRYGDVKSLILRRILQDPEFLAFSKPRRLRILVAIFDIFEKF
jgi:hypothetical protein